MGGQEDALRSAREKAAEASDVLEVGGSRYGGYPFGVLMTTASYYVGGTYEGSLSLARAQVVGTDPCFVTRSSPREAKTWPADKVDRYWNEAVRV